MSFGTERASNLLANNISAAYHIATKTNIIVSTSNNEEENVPIFVSIDSVYHFFNHSCVRTTTRIWYGDFVVAKNLIPIKKNQQIFGNHGFYFHGSPRAVRQQKLYDLYNFVCGCEACANHWPIVCVDKPPPYMTTSRNMIS